MELVTAVQKKPATVSKVSSQTPSLCGIMLNMEYVDNDYSVLLDDPQPDVKNPEAKPAENETREPENKKPWWSMEFYQRFFNVTTEDVVMRLNQSMMPWPSVDTLSNCFQENPDLYGPFWICATLALEMGLSSNAAYYQQNYGQRSWRQTVRTVYQAAVLLFLYCWCLPTLLWIGLEWNPLSTHKFRLTELWCVFSYASAILMPAATVWAVPIVWLRWLVSHAASLVSGMLICRYTKKALCQLQPSSFYTLQAMFFAVNYIVGCSFLVLFFPQDYLVTTPALISNSTVSTSLLWTSVLINETTNIDTLSANFSQNTTSPF